MLARYFVLFCLAGIIEIIFLALGNGTSVFSIAAALLIIFLSVRILGLKFVNGRIIRLAIWFSLLNLALGNMPLILAQPADRLKPVSSSFNGSIPVLSKIFSGPLDNYLLFWLCQSFLFTMIFLSMFIIFSKILRRLDNNKQYA
jgi:hypothetical protein